mmetsp:Transcript_22996/g.44882  ORF Transcript_22996/g.44882 Transcript_22996/m.44882 type:complete len:93 (-) Transcript_22996:362-640(-)
MTSSIIKTPKKIPRLGKKKKHNLSPRTVLSFFFFFLKKKKKEKSGGEREESYCLYKIDQNKDGPTTVKRTPYCEKRHQARNCVKRDDADNFF